MYVSDSVSNCVFASEIITSLIMCICSERALNETPGELMYVSSDVVSICVMLEKEGLVIELSVVSSSVVINSFAETCLRIIIFWGFFCSSSEINTFSTSLPGGVDLRLLGALIFLNLVDLECDKMDDNRDDK